MEAAHDIGSPYGLGWTTGVAAMIGSDDGASSSGGTARDGAGAGSFTFLPFRRERFPFRESVLWTPVTPGPVWERAHRGCDLVIDRAVLEELRTRFDRALEEGATGLLLGRLCECPWTRRPWAHVGAVAMARAASGSPEREVESLLLAPRPPGVLALGWLRVRSGPVALTASEAELHRRRFDEPWQFAVLLVSGPGGAAIGVFAADEDEEMDGARQRPFYERLDDPDVPERERSWGRTGSDGGGWRNYERSPRGAARPVRRAGGAVAKGPDPDPLRWAAIVVGIGAGLALAGELVPRYGASVSSAATPMAFASPRASPPPGRGTGTEDEASPLAFEERFAEFGRTTEAYLRLGRYARTGATDCERLGEAHRAVGDAFERLSEAAAASSGPGVRSRLGDAAAVKRMIDRRFAEAGCPAAEEEG